VSFQKEITPELVVLVCWKQGLRHQNPVFELKNYWTPGKRDGVYEGVVVSTVSLIWSLNMTPWNEQVGTTAHWSHVAWYNPQSPFFRQVYAAAWHLKRMYPLRDHIQCACLNDHTNSENLLHSLVANFPFVISECYCSLWRGRRPPPPTQEKISTTLYETSA